MKDWPFGPRPVEVPPQHAPRFGSQQLDQVFACWTAPASKDVRCPVGAKICDIRAVREIGKGILDGGKVAARVARIVDTPTTMAERSMGASRNFGERFFTAFENYSIRPDDDADRITTGVVCLARVQKELQKMYTRVAMDSDPKWSVAALYRIAMTLFVVSARLNYLVPEGPIPANDAYASLEEFESAIRSVQIAGCKQMTEAVRLAHDVHVDNEWSAAAQKELDDRCGVERI